MEFLTHQYLFDANTLIMGLFSRLTGSGSNHQKSEHVSPVSSGDKISTDAKTNQTSAQSSSSASSSSNNEVVSSGNKTKADGDKLIECDTMITKPPQSYYDLLPKLLKEHEETKLTSEQEAMYEKLHSLLTDPEFKLPVKNCTKWEEEPKEEWIPLTSWEKFYLTKECLLRFLVGCKWHFDNVKKVLLETLVWRREFGLTYDEENFKNCIQPEDLSEENETGKQILLGFDKKGHVLLYMKDGLQNTDSSLNKVKHMIYMIEQAVLWNPKGVSKVVILVDFKHYPEVPGVLKKRKMTPLSIAKQCLHICQTYYPETLGYAVFINIPWLGWTFLKLMVPFVDPNTKKRFVFDEPFTNYIDPNNLEAAYGGNLDFHYNHKKYWPDFIEKSRERRINNYNKFLELGGCVGVSEYDIKD